MDDIDLNFKTFPRGDARRYLLVLLTIDQLQNKEATTYSIAVAITATRAEVERAIQALVTQFGVVFRREPTARRADYSRYFIEDWGILNRKKAEAFLRNQHEGAIVDGKPASPFA